MKTRCASAKCSLIVAGVSVLLSLLLPAAGQAAALSGVYEVLASASTVNLTTEGTLDWAHWGRTSPTDFNHRADVTPQISNFTLIGQGPILQFADNFTGYSWSNGTPTARATRSTSGIYVNSDDNGFEISVPADTTVKTLKVYVGAYAAQMHFEASLSDNSAPMYVDESFENPSDGPNRAYVLNFAAASAGQKLTVRYWVINSGGGNVTLQAAALREGAPLVELVKPVNGSIFHPASEGLQFNASTISPNSIPTDAVKLILNDRDVSAQLTLAGSETSRTATFNQLESNRFYQGLVIVADTNNQGTTNQFVFDTFSTSGTVVIEAEDYNYSIDGVNGGSFLDNPPPNAYQEFFGVPEVDYHTASQGTSFYRSADAVVADDATDQLRQAWVDAGALDYHVMDLEPGDWLNYTRTFPAGNFNVYLRYAALVDQVLQLDQVTSNAGQPNQSLKLLGSINAIRTGNENSYRYAPMTDALGNPLFVSLSGRQTLRLTGVTVEPGFNGLRANFLLLAPSTGPATRGPAIDFASPAPDAEDVAPDAGIQVIILNGDTAVVPNTIRLLFDESDVTTAANIQSTATGATIAYQPPAMLGLDSVHSIAVIHSDNSTPPVIQTNRWSFFVANLPLLSGAWATAPGSGRTNGFAIKMAQAPIDSDGALFTNEAERAELQLAGQLIDPLTEQPFPNQVTGPAANGLFIETNTINYQQDGTEIGYFTGDTLFPGVDPGDPNYMAMQASFYLDLVAGLHRLGVRSDDGFVLMAGPSLTNVTLELGQYEGGRGSDLPAGSTEFEFLVEKSGVYAFRLLWYEGTGGADLELFSVNRSTLGSASVVRTLVNDPGNAQSIKAYTGREGVPIQAPDAPTLGAARIAGGNLSFAFATQSGASYTVQSKQRLSDPAWQDTTVVVTGNGTEQTVNLPLASGSGFYRVVAR
ncbi:MAG: hypothetical protein AB9869_09080 [Verrucomicrobiia bacterium]